MRDELFVEIGKGLQYSVPLFLPSLQGCRSWPGRSRMGVQASDLLLCSFSSPAGAI